MEYYSTITKNKTASFATTRMQLESIILSEVSQKEKDKYYMIPHMCNLKYDTNELIHKTEIDTENILMIAKKGLREGWTASLGVWGG